MTADGPAGGEVLVPDPREVAEPFGVRVAPVGVKVRNPAFDVTPAKYVSAIVTERGVARPPYTESLAAMAAAQGDD